MHPSIPCSTARLEPPAATGTPAQCALRVVNLRRRAGPADGVWVGRIRREAVATVERAGYGQEAADLENSVALVVSELVTNGLLHGAVDTDVCVSVHCCVDTVLITVDSGVKDAEPVLRNAFLTDESGRGLMITDAVSKEWGYTQRGDVLRLWAQLPVMRGKAS